MTGRDPTKERLEEEEDHLPWTLSLHFNNYPVIIMKRGPLNSMQDVFMNSLKESDYVRNGNAKAVMSLSESESNTFWKAVCDCDISNFSQMADRLYMHARNAPLKLYLTASSYVLQSPVALPSSLGSALHKLLPDLFPSAKICLLAKPVFHGVAAPMTAPLSELMRDAGYPDGVLHISIVMMS